MAVLIRQFWGHDLRLSDQGVGGENRNCYNQKILATKVCFMIPGEIFTPDGEIELNAGQSTLRLTVANSGDRPIQIGSHYHFYEANSALQFDRAASKGRRLDIPAGTAIRFEPGDEKEVTLVVLRGSREVYGFNAQVEGKLDPP